MGLGKKRLTLFDLKCFETSKNHTLKKSILKKYYGEIFFFKSANFEHGVIFYKALKWGWVKKKLF